MAITALLWCGCDFRPKPTYQSPRRILALDVRQQNPPDVTVKYLLTTNEAYVRGGDLGVFRGDITAATISSNAAEWRLQICFKGTTTAGTAVDFTNALNVPYTRYSRFSVPGIGTVTGSFLSDQGLTEFDQRFPKSK